ncbi:MAG: PQQ-binding-like beta-propeller repeat protein, partial [Vicinamibacterales bacterium]
MSNRTLALLGVLALASVALTGQGLGLDPSLLLKPPTDAWPTYHGDYSGRRYSTLKQINAENVKNLTLAWIYRVNTSPARAIIGGEGPDTPPASASGFGLAIKSTPLMVNGVLYFSVPDHVWAIDARTGREIWHYFWRTKGGIHIGNRGVGMFGNWLYFLTPDNYFVSLDAATGKERWHREIASVKREYFSTNAPIVIGNRILIGVGGDSLDVPGYLEARDPEAGEVIWRWNTTPRPGEPGSETWPDEYSMLHGGGMPWLPGTYDPDLNLYYVGTGNANPVLAGQSRAGDNLWTCSIVALNVDTGKMA